MNKMFPATDMAHSMLRAPGLMFVSQVGRLPKPAAAGLLGQSAAVALHVMVLRQPAGFRTYLA
jgi:hypothetical protein